MANIAPQPRFRAFDANGDPLSGGKLYTYEAGTSTLKDTYTTADGDVPNANPVVLDADGYADIWLGDGGYKFILKNSADVELWSVDDIGGSSSTAFGGDVNTISANTVINSVYANSVILASGTISLSLAAASDVGEGFYFSVKNTSSGVITIDPDGSETINGASTLALAQDESALIITNGVAWFSLFLYQGFAKVGAANTFTEPNAFNKTVTMGAAFNANKGADIASATTTDIGAATGNFIHVTGTTTITGLGTIQAGTERTVRFAGVLTLTHNATSLILPTGANITTAAGDTARFISEGSGNWRCVSYNRSTGVAVSTDGSGLTSIRSATVVAPVATTSGTSVTIASGLPSGIKQITINFEGVSTSGTSNPMIQIGDSGGIEATGYTSASSVFTSSVTTGNHTTGFGIRASLAANTLRGSMILTLMDESTNLWSCQAILTGSTTFTVITAGTKALSATLDRLAITTEGGTDTFDAGSINITYIR